MCMYISSYGSCGEAWSQSLSLEAVLLCCWWVEHTCNLCSSSVGFFIEVSGLTAKISSVTIHSSISDVFVCTCTCTYRYMYAYAYTH